MEGKVGRNQRLTFHNSLLLDMTTNRSTSTKLFLLSLGALLIFIGSGCNSAAPITPAPFANDGLLDLTNWDFKKKGIIGLGGEWKVYWGELFTPMDLPDDWDGAIAMDEK
ncbi:MAG: hypothetical protein ACI837_001800 [Crocinitomicaceae bacterium]|jgi:hypothetical protein